jgi:tetratricopeptide (TPR) repeat protein
MSRSSHASSARAATHAVVLALAAASLACGRAAPVPPPPARDVEAISLLGDTLRRPSLDGDARAALEQRLAEAAAAAAARPADADAAIWHGRRLAYLGRYRDAIDVYTAALAKHPDDARLLRHRGHRWITVRELDRAVADLERAASLTRGRPDEVEPDGIPNARNTPIGTPQSNIWYPLALAHYLRGDLASARRAAEEGMRLAANPDRLVSQSHWLYLTLRRMGREAEAAALLQPVSRELDVIENDGYRDLLLVYAGSLDADSLLATVRPGAGSGDVSVAYGIAAWHLAEGRTARGERILRDILDGGQWAAFGFIAAEADLARR